MLHILKAFGIPTRLVDPIGKVYEEKLATVLCPDGETEFFKIMRQGDTLAPYLFIISFFFFGLYFTRGYRGSRRESLGITIKPRQGRWVKAENVTHLNFSDDIALFSDQFQQAQRLLRNVEAASAQVSLLTNAKCMFFNHQVDPGLKTRDDEAFEPVENFKYLKSVTENMTSRSERFQLG